MLKIIITISLLFVFTTQVNAQLELKNTPEKKIERLTEHQSNYYDKGDYEKFKLYTDSILQIARKNNLKEIEIDAIIRLGVYYKKKAEYDEALSYYLKALEKSKTIPDTFKKQTVILINAGNIYNVIKDTTRAKASFTEALGYIQKHKGPDIYKMACYIGLGGVASVKKEYEKSLDYHLKAKEIGEKLNRDDIIIAALNNMADNYLNLEKYNNSLESSEKALRLYTNKQSLERRALSLFLKGAALLKLKKYDEGILALQMAQGIAFTNEYQSIQMDTHRKLAEAFEEKGDLKRANIELKQYKKYKELYLKTLSKTDRVLIEQELAEKEEVLARLNNDITKLSSEKKYYLVLGLICIFVLSGILLFYVKRNKLTKLEAIQLKEDRLLLKNENEALKTKIYKLAEQNTSPSNSKENNATSYQKSSLSQEDRELYLKRILEYMETEKPFLDMDIKQSDIAENLSMTVHQFSEVLNVSLKKNFNNFINLYRINEAKKMMKKPEYENYKILAIAYEAGFNSKTSFNRVFKQLVGQTPSEYKQQFG
ncbi:helix-turn-helix domain-containing protein [Aquimarina celericrescens]|uniref:Helix-turn-helix domain-containing protein n=1 Tax=Aquimarina celericrescens TaxID=1964542 RepID=A0ABW5AWY7_9FLAO|nr:tetratricopeptide repeat protein [Aquimarina celericrescens]